jgi:hypothetical protein
MSYAPGASVDSGLLARLRLESRGCENGVKMSYNWRHDERHTNLVPDRFR